MKNVQIRNFFWSVFSCIWTEYGIYSVNLHIQSKHRKIRASVFGHFSCSEYRSWEVLLSLMSMIKFTGKHMRSPPFLVRYKPLKNTSLLFLLNSLIFFRSPILEDNLDDCEKPVRIYSFSFSNFLYLDWIQKFTSNSLKIFAFSASTRKIQKKKLFI